MDTTGIIALLVLVALAVAAVLIIRAATRKQRREELQERFGPEYDRAVDEHGGRRSAERKLAEVADRRDQLDIRELEPAERERYAAEWVAVQASFVDDPMTAVNHADRLVAQVMRDRGYPVDDFETRHDMVAADHPHIAENYRAAHAIRRRLGEDDGFDTDDMRQAFVHYRALFDELLADGGQVSPYAGSHRRSAADTDDAAAAESGAAAPAAAKSGAPAAAEPGAAAEHRDAPRQVDLTERERTHQLPPQR